MDWDMYGGSESGSEDSFGAGSAVSDADAAALGMNTQPPEFYDPDADDKDEQWMQKMRKSHRSDAILSCPLCFTTLCIDCQQHEKWENQFRAMFVMNCRVKTNEAVTIPTPPGKRGKQQRRQQRRAQQQQEQQEQAAAAAAQQAADAAAGQQPVAGEQQPPAAGEQPQAHQPAAQGGAAAGAAAGGGGAGGGGGEGPLNPVCCAVCDTEVGLRDQDGVYVFFNVFASNS